MAILSEQQSRWLWGFAAGVAATLIVREFLPHFKEVGKPLAKATVRSALTAFERSREGLSRLSESMEDIVAEVQHEMGQERSREQQETGERKG
jgi:hypothetical protein